MIKWKQTGRFEALSNMGHKALERVIHGQDSIYTVLSPEGKILGFTRDRSEINVIAEK